MTEFMNGYVSLQDVSNAYFGGTLEEHGLEDFDAMQTELDVMKLLGNYAASNWMNTDLESEFYLKGFNWMSGEEDPSYAANAPVVIAEWAALLVSLKMQHYHIDENTKECIQKVMDQFNWVDFQTELNKPDYKWGLVHGDFHPGQLMYNLDGSGDLVLLDWEFAGIFGNPAIDLVTWTWGTTGTKIAEEIEDELLEAYWTALIEGGVSETEYPFDKFYADYRIYGFAQLVTRFIGLYSPIIPR